MTSLEDWTQIRDSTTIGIGPIRTHSFTPERWRIVNGLIDDIDQALRFRPGCACYREWYGSATCLHHQAMIDRRQELLDSVDWAEIHCLIGGGD